MSLTGTLSSPTFNLFIGLGISLLISNIKDNKPVPFSIKRQAIIEPLVVIIG